MFSTLIKDPAVQSTYYHPGLGTMAPPGFVTTLGSRIAEIAGLAFGYGLNNDIRDAYVFIADNFEDGDRLFLFGFASQRPNAVSPPPLRLCWGSCAAGPPLRMIGMPVRRA